MTTASDAPPTPEIDPDIAPPAPPGETRQVVGDLIEAEVEEPEVTELSTEERNDFATLMTVGRRSKKISILGHTVTIQTLRTSDEMRIGLYTKPYLESQGFARAYQVAICACGIREVDGAPLYSSLTEVVDEDEAFDKRVEKMEQYYPIVVTKIYQKIMELEREFAELAIKLGKADG
jgi:hypothetical protein